MAAHCLKMDTVKGNKGKLVTSDFHLWSSNIQIATVWLHMEYSYSLSCIKSLGCANGRRDDHYIDAYMTLLHIWWLINRIKTYRFGLSIDIGHDGVIDHNVRRTIRAKYAHVFNFWVKYQDTWSLPNNFCTINSRRFLLTAVNWLMRAIVVGYSACTDLPAGHTFPNWSAHCRNLCVTW